MIARAEVAEVQAEPALFLSVVVPAHNEVGSVATTIARLHAALAEQAVPHELVVVDDASVDGTGELLDALAERLPELTVVHREGPSGVGRAVRAGLQAIRGDAAVVVMADGSEHPSDVCDYYRVLQQGYDAVFGSRFMSGGSVEGYPWFKLALNRLGNHAVRLLFGRRENDLSNAFKAYSAAVLRDIGPLRSDQFEIFIELPLEAMTVGADIATVPIAWHGRRAGASKLKLMQQMPRYARMVFRLWRSHRGSVRRRGRPALAAPAGALAPQC
jgi:dolichol-phosphate mannosyltransferase